MRTELVAPPAPAGASPGGQAAGAFEDERPIVRKAAGLKLGGVVITVAIVAVLVILALRPSSTKTAALATPPASPPRAALAAPSSEPLPPLARATAETPAAAPSAATPASKPAPATRVEAGVRAPSRSKSRRSSGDVVRDITSKAGVERELAAPADKASPSTPAELKNPFGNP
jgi:hypothetical protein